MATKAAVTLDELKKQFSLSAETLEKPCTDDHIAAVAVDLISWETTAVHLGLNEAEIEAIDRDAKSTEEMRLKALQKWRSKFAHEATYKKLICTFLGVGNAQLASKVCKLLACGQEEGVSSPDPCPAETSSSTSLSIASDNALPYLEAPHLTENEMSALRGRLVDESQQMMLRFNKLIQQTTKSLKDKQVTPDELRLTLMCLEAFDPVSDKRLPMFHQCLEDMMTESSIEKIILNIRGYISFIQYDILEHIIESHGTETDEKNLQDYKKELGEFCKRRVSEFPPLYGHPSKSGTTVVVVLDKVLQHYTLKGVDHLRNKLAKILQVQPQALKLLQVKEGSVQLTFQIPSCIVNLVFPLSQQQQEALKEEGVIKLTCDVCSYSFLLQTDDTSTEPKRSTDSGNSSLCTDMKGASIASQTASSKCHREPSRITITRNKEGHRIVAVLATLGPLPDRQQEIKFTDLNIIGNGSFGVVYQARLLETNDLVAIKKVLQDKRFQNREIQVMRQLDHCNVIWLHYFFYMSGKKDEVYLNLVLDFIPETVYRVIRHHSQAKQITPVLYIKLYMYQLFRSLAYIHAIGLCHRDIKPQNLLLDPESGVLKLCDFGSAKVLVKGEPNVSYICSRYYRAPELIFGATDYTCNVDVWSAGCVFAELLLGQFIFPGDSGVDQLVEIIKVLGTPTKEQIRQMNSEYLEFKFPKIKAYPWHKVFRPRTSPEAIDLVSQLLVYAPTQRINPMVACAHTFFDELRRSGTKMPNGRELPPLFNFTPQELAIQPSLQSILIPAHLSDSSNSTSSFSQPSTL